MIKSIKLVVGEAIHKLNISNVSSDEVLKNVKNIGYHVIPDFIDSHICKQLRDKIDVFIDANPDKVKIESGGSDVRIYGVDRYTKQFNVDELINTSNNLFSSFSWSIKPERFTLIGRIRSMESNLGSGGGWHRDSPIRHQFKTIMYLSDVESNNGPFQYIPYSHRYSSVKKSANYLNVDLSKRRFTEEEIQNLIDNNIVSKLKEFTAKAGTVIVVDTRGLHRGKPLKSGDRYAITNYHFENGVSNNFK